MFDTKITHVDASGPRRVDVHEHKAPTDASVALLQEMQEKALKSIIHSQPLEAAGIKGAVVHMFNVFGGPELHISFAVGNSGRRDVKVKLDDHQTTMMEVSEYATYMIVEVSIEIARQLLMDSTDVRRMIEGRFR
jgi:hypothetical protein